MHGIVQTSIPLNEVTALFAGSTASFSLSNRATFADLADRLGDLAERHIGIPRAIYLKLGCPGSTPGFVPPLSRGIF
jgi:hypothetical protein